MNFSILEAPSVLGLRPDGVETLPAALLAAGLAERLGAPLAGRIESSPYGFDRDNDTQILNAPAIREYSVRLAKMITPLLERDRVPLLLGGDCSILLGAGLALRRRGNSGLLFLDGHSDFYSAAASPTGEAADMDLALATGRGPSLLCNIEGFSSYFRDVDVAAFGFRDADDVERDGGPDIFATDITAIPLKEVRSVGLHSAIDRALGVVARPELNGFWIHLDADVLDGDQMFAVDYRMADGLSFADLAFVLRRAIGTGRVQGIEVTILNPLLDPSGRVVNEFVDCLVSGLVEL